MSGTASISQTVDRAWMCFPVEEQPGLQPATRACEKHQAFGVKSHLNSTKTALEAKSQSPKRA